MDASSNPSSSDVASAIQGHDPSRAAHSDLEYMAEAASIPREIGGLDGIWLAW